MSGSKSARCIPEDRGRIVTAFLESFFTRLSSTASPPASRRSSTRSRPATLDWKDVLRDFWTDFTSARPTRSRTCASPRCSMRSTRCSPDHIFPAKADGSDPRRCPTCGTGQLSLKLGKFGAFIGCSNYPECKHTMQLSDAASGGQRKPRPATASSASIRRAACEVLLKSGRFGPYVQLGDGDEPKRSSLPKGWDARQPDAREGAAAADAAPRGRPSPGNAACRSAPASAATVRSSCMTANTPTCPTSRKSSPSASTAPSICSPRRPPAAAGSAGGAPRSRRSRPSSTTTAPISVRDGRYGPYVNQGKVNATLPKTVKPEDVTLEQALELIAERAAKTGGKKPARKAAAKKAPAKKAAQSGQESPQPRRPPRNRQPEGRTKPRRPHPEDEGGRTSA